MKDILTHQVLIGGKQVTQQPNRLLFWQPQLRFEVGCNIPALTILRNDVAVVGGVVYLLQLDNVWMVQLPQQCDLTLEHVSEAGALLFTHFDHLDANHLTYACDASYLFGRYILCKPSR